MRIYISVHDKIKESVYKRCIKDINIAEDRLKRKEKN